jgi:ABC-type sugar transport system ATPase subunit
VHADLVRAPGAQLRFEQASMAYVSNAPTLTDISFEARPGQMVALVGPSGAGKTTLTYLASRLYDPVGGRITFDGVDLREFALDDLSRWMAMVTQETTLFNATLEENLRYAKQDASREELERACRLAQLHEVIAAPIIPPMSAEVLAKVRTLQAELEKLPQVPVQMHHVLHGRMYARTCFVPAGHIAACCLVKVPTIVALAGSANLYVGKDEPLRLEGYNVLAASAGRKQAFLSLTDIALTMYTVTNAKTVEEAENELTDEAHTLASRRDGLNTTVITGE